MNAEYIESNLLNQLRLVTVGHIFPVWIHKTCIFVKAGKLKKTSVVALNFVVHSVIHFAFSPSSFSTDKTSILDLS